MAFANYQDKMANTPLGSNTKRRKKLTTNQNLNAQFDAIREQRSVLKRRRFLASKVALQKKVSRKESSKKVFDIFTEPTHKKLVEKERMLASEKSEQTQQAEQIAENVNLSHDKALREQKAIHAHRVVTNLNENVARLKKEERDKVFAQSKRGKVKSFFVSKKIVTPKGVITKKSKFSKGFNLVKKGTKKGIKATKKNVEDTAVGGAITLGSIHHSMKL